MSVVVARSVTEERIQLDAQCPPIVEIRAGQRLELKLVFRVRDNEEGKDTFRHTLESSIGDIHPAAVHDDHADRRVWNDDKNAMIGQAFRFDGPGEHEGRYRVVVEHELTGWDSSTTKSQRRELSGTFRVVVR